MITRALGNTGLKVSILGFGCSPLGGVFGEVGQEQADRMVRMAIDSGVNLFDTSPFYGITRSESVLGEALKGIERSRYILATKVGRYDGALFDFSAQRVTRSVDESLARLQTDFVDLIQCHDIEFGSLDQVVNETIPALERLRSAGKVRYIGITGLPLKIFPYVLERCAVDTILSYCHYTLYDDSLLAILPGMRVRGAGVISAAPLGMGLLTDGPLAAWHPAPPELRRVCAEAAVICREMSGVDLASLALQYALQTPQIDSTLVGIGSAEQLQRNLACVGVAPDPDLLARVQACLAAVRNTTWPSGRPENND